MKRNIFDLNHIKSVRVWVLLHNGEYAGRIIGNFSDNPNGAVCTVAVHIWEQFENLLCPLMNDSFGYEAKSGGGGYDKFAASIAKVMCGRYGLISDWTPGKVFAFDSNPRSAFEKLGFTVIEAL